MADDKIFFSFNEFVSKFDVVTSSYLSSHDEIHRFLDILNSENLDEKYEFVFPLFYDFKISNGEVLFLPKANGESYEWLIGNSNSIKERVIEHTSYGIGITESYCKSAIPPSYLKIKRSSVSKEIIDVAIEPYNNKLFCENYLSLSINTSKLDIETIDDNRGQNLDPISDGQDLLDKLKVNWTDLDFKQEIEQQKLGLDIVSLEKGIKAHYPIIEKGESVLYYFFTNNLQVKDNKKRGFGGLFAIAKEELNDAELGFFILAGYTLANKVALSQIQHSARIEAIKSAIAAIMSRNMSHNLGSHFVSNTKNDFGRQINDDRIFDKNKVKQEDLNAFRMDYRGNVRLLQYIQERMDFIATIISTDLYALSPINFKAEFFDILTNDDCGERHGKPERNFLLQYLLYSEKYTRTGLDKNDGFDNVRLVVNYNGKQYTGLTKNREEEKDLKTELSKLRLAVPGGVMSRHALLTIVENILRNSAKHNEHVDELVLTIEIKKEKGKWELSFYDNCNSAEKKVKRSDGTEIEVYQSIEDKLKHAIIINDEGALDKYDKGLKEMLICALWLQNKDVAETLLKIQQGVDTTDYIKVGEKEGNLCYTINLENFEDHKEINKQPSVEELLGIHADFIISKEDYAVGKNDNVKKLSEIFPRFIQGTWDNAQKIMDKKLEEYALVVEADIGEEKLPSVYFKDDKSIPKEKKRICFYDHLTNVGNAKKKNDFEVAKNDEKIVYLDSISGENFTSTLVTPLFLKEDIQKYKVIESALAKIAIIDERIWSDCRSRCTIRTESDNANKEQYSVVLNRLNETGMTSSKLLSDISQIDYDYYQELDKSIQGMSEESNKLERLKTLLKEKIDAKLFVPDITCQLLETKRIYVYSIEDGKLIGLDGNEATELPDFNFVTVHLGLIEKLPKASGGFEKFLADKVIGKKSGNHGPFVVIHSGRGNLSPELEDSLRNYPFLNLSAVESALNNSKYLLSELFYNTNYYGKGNTNHK